MSLLSRLAVQAARAYGVLSAVDKNKVSADYLVVAGGAGGGSDGGGGGGAGGLLTSTATLSTLTTYSITVGAGGLGGTASGDGGTGNNSVLSGTGLTTLTASGGGGGGGFARVGVNGGSGGGGGMRSARAGGTGISGQGFAGGTSSTGSGEGAGGGGGGASAVGGTVTNTKIAGNGGAGTASSISGSSITYAGGGGGSTRNADGTYTNGTGGAGGGGNGALQNAAAGNGTTNLGGGGGGGDANSTGAGGSGGSGIVIISYTSATPLFVGGTITTSGGKQIHTFTSSGTLSPLTPVTASYLVVAGGGGGGQGGGGAGGLLTSSTTIYSGATYVVTVGGGGAAVTNGSNSSFSGTGLTTLTAIGGGRGGQPGSINGSSGGSGGAGRYDGSGGAGTSGQGNAGGNGGGASADYPSGGGGGAGAVGQTPASSSANGGNGGIGIQSSISGTATYYAGGGGGGTDGATSGTGGAGGGANGTTNTVPAGATPNTGGGGGGRNSSTPAGAGGSGIVIISYAGSQAFNGGLVTSSGGNTIHTFTSTGALTPLTNNLTNSLRFRSSNSNYLNRTFVTPTDNKKWTYSGWVKRGTLGSASQQHFFNYWTGGTGQAGILFSATTDTIEFFDYTGSYGYQLVTTQVFRDPSAWYHFVIAVDTTQATAANRIKMYVNGNQITAFGTSTYPSLNYNTLINSANAHYIGRRGDSSGYFDGYQTDINFIDGQALEPYYFGNNDANGVWKPILYKGTYGTNGFYLTFGNTTSTTTLGYDSSPNGNNWTTNNISLTAGVTYDAMTDVPTNTSATVANYCVLNQLNKNTNVTVSNASLTSTSAVSNAGISGTMYVKSSGKYYWEATCTTKTTYPIVGIVNEAWSSGTNALTYPGATSGSYGYANDGLKYNNGSTASYGASYTSGDIIGVALDLDAGTLTFYKNNTSQGTAYTGLTDSYAPAVSGQASDVWNMNFGQLPFAYTPPSGFVRLNTFNLSTPTILQGNKYMDATTYTGTGTALNVVNQGQFRPDLVWLKSRSQAYNNGLFDSNRGTTRELVSNSAGTETNGVTGLTAFNSNGFTIGTNPGFNESATTFVGWQWQAGQGSTSSNTSGTITSTVSVNTTAGFSVVTWTANGVNGATVGHGLGVAPKMMIVKCRSNTQSFPVYHTTLGNTKYLMLNTTAAEVANIGMWNNTSPTSTVFTTGDSGFLWGTNFTYVAYCWAEIAGFSAFGSYTGNGNANGPFVYTGFRPEFIMYKRTDAIQSWILMDTSRSPYNVADKFLIANNSDSEYTGTILDMLSNGFKVREAGTQTNASGGTYIYMAFAENPFKISNAR